MAVFHDYLWKNVEFLYLKKMVILRGKLSIYQRKTPEKPGDCDFPSACSTWIVLGR